MPMSSGLATSAPGPTSRHWLANRSVDQSPPPTLGAGWNELSILLRSPKLRSEPFSAHADRARLGVAGARRPPFARGSE